MPSPLRWALLSAGCWRPVMAFVHVLQALQPERFVTEALVQQGKGR